MWGRSSAGRARRSRRFARCCKSAARRRVCVARWKSSKTSARRSDFDQRETLMTGMKIDVLTLFPGMFAGPLDESIVKRAREAGVLELAIHNLRDYTHDRHKTVDDKPFGGGPGMLLKPEPIFEAVEKQIGRAQ